MQLKTKFLSFISLFFISITVYGQLNEIEYFADSTGRYSSYISDAIQLEDAVVYTGIIEQDNINIPFMSRIDTNGVVIWSTLQYDYNTVNSSYKFDLLESDDGYIYGLTYEYNAQFNFSKFIWKVDKTTGKIVYKTNFYLNDNSIMKLYDYDSSYLMAAYRSNTLGHSYIALIHKSTGDTLKTARYPYGEVNLARDKNKNIVHSIGPRLIKYNGMNLDQVIWEKSYNNDLKLKLNTIYRIYIDDYNDIYLFGDGGVRTLSRNCIAMKIDNSNGNEIWRNEIKVGDYLSITDMVDKNGYLYITYEDLLSGSVQYRYFMGKVHKQSGSVPIERSYYITANGASPNTDEQRAYALDVDCNGDIYLNGRYFNSNTSTLQWGVIKVNGLNSNKILDKTISNGLTGANNNGKGSTAHAFKNTLIFLGEMNNKSGNLEVSFVKYDAVTDSVIIQKKLENGFKIKSEVVEMIRHNDSLLVLKQEGPKLNVSLYNQYGINVWTQELSTSDSIIEIGGNIVTDGKKVYVSSIEYLDSNYLPNYTNSQKLLKVNQLDFKSGNSISTTSSSLKTLNPGLQDIEIVDNKAFIFYYDYYYYYTKWNTGGLTAPTYISNELSSNDKGNKTKIFHNDTNLIIFCRSSIKWINDQFSFPSTNVKFTSGDYIWNDLTIIADTIYAVGKGYSTPNHVILAFNRKNNTILWKKEFSNTNGLRKIKAYNKNLYVSGINTDHIEVYSLSIDSAKVNWKYQLDSVQYLNAEVYDMALIGNKNELAIVGGINQTNNSENGIICLLELSGNPIQNYKLEGKPDFINYANNIENFQDSGYWIGGSINRPSFLEEGFIYSLNTKPFLTTSLNQLSKVLDKSEQTFIIYPNPSSSVLNIEGAQEKVISYKVYNIMGKELMRVAQTSQRTVDVSGITKGTYLLIIESENIREIFRFIKM